MGGHSIPASRVLFPRIPRVPSRQSLRLMGVAGGTDGMSRGSRYGGSNGYIRNKKCTKGNRYIGDDKYTLWMKYTRTQRVHLTDMGITGVPGTPGELGIPEYGLYQPDRSDDNHRYAQTPDDQPRNTVRDFFVSASSLPSRAACNGSRSGHRWFRYILNIRKRYGCYCHTMQHEGRALL